MFRVIVYLWYNKIMACLFSSLDQQQLCSDPGKYNSELLQRLITYLRQVLSVIHTFLLYLTSVLSNIQSTVHYFLLTCTHSRNICHRSKQQLCTLYVNLFANILIVKKIENSELHNIKPFVLEMMLQIL